MLCDLAEQIPALPAHYRYGPRSFHPLTKINVASKCYFKMYLTLQNTQKQQMVVEHNFRLVTFMNEREAAESKLVSIKNEAQASESDLRVEIARLHEVRDIIGLL